MQCYSLTGKLKKNCCKACLTLVFVNPWMQCQGYMRSRPLRTEVLCHISSMPSITSIQDSTRRRDVIAPLTIS